MMFIKNGMLNEEIFNLLLIKSKVIANIPINKNIKTNK